jgi:hypothetical protein
METRLPRLVEMSNLGAMVEVVDFCALLLIV